MGVVLVTMLICELNTGYARMMAGFLFKYFSWISISVLGRDGTDCLRGV